MPPTVTKALAPFEVKAIDEEARTFTGLASTWDEDLGGDVIHRGAFKETLAEWESGGKVLPLIDQHNYGSIRSVVGKMVSAKETKSGLLAEFKVIEGPDGDEVFRRIKGNYVDGLSIGYEPVKWEFEEDSASRWGRIRHLKEIKLHEVSVVIWPMNTGATIDANTVKAMLDGIEDAPTLRSLAGHIGNRVKRLQSQPEPPEVTPSQEADSQTAPDAPDTSLLDRLKLARLGVKFSPKEGQHGDEHGSSEAVGARQDPAGSDEATGEVRGEALGEG